MTLYTGTLPYGSGTITAYADVADGKFSSSRVVATVKVTDKGGYALSLPKAGTYRIRISTLAAMYPDFTVSAADGLTTAALTLSTPVLRNAPTDQSAATAGGGGGNGAKGDKGDPGSPGPAGPKGDTGPQGPAGTGGTGGGSLPAGLGGLATQKPDGSWTVTKAQADALHAAGAAISWWADGSISPVLLPTPANGLADGDLVNGERPAQTPITIPANAAPVGNDQPGTANDTVTLTKVDGVTWVVDGVDHPSANFTGATKVVNYAKGVGTNVAAKPSTGLYTITGTASWSLPFSTGSASVITSEDFTRPDGALTAGTFNTNAAKGGTSIAASITGSGLSVVGNTLKITGNSNELSMPYTGVTNAAIDVKVPTLPVGTNGVIVSPARANGGTAYIEASIAPSGQVWFGKMETGGAYTSVNTGQIINAGGSVHIEKVGKAMKVTSTKADGTTGGNAYTVTFTNDFTPVRAYVKADNAMTTAFIDDIVVTSL